MNGAKKLNVMDLDPATGPKNSNRGGFTQNSTLKFPDFELPPVLRRETSADYVFNMDNAQVRLGPSVPVPKSNKDRHDAPEKMGNWPAPEPETVKKQKTTKGSGNRMATGTVSNHRGSLHSNPGLPVRVRDQSGESKGEPAIPQVPKTRETTVIPEYFPKVPMPEHKKTKLFRYRPKINKEGPMTMQDVNELFMMSYEDLMPHSFAPPQDTQYCIYFNVYKPVLIEFEEYMKTFGFRDKSSPFYEKMKESNVITIQLETDSPQAKELDYFYETAAQDFLTYLRTSLQCMSLPQHVQMCTQFGKLVKPPEKEWSDDGTMRFSSLMSGKVTQRTQIRWQPDYKTQQTTVPWNTRIKILFVFGGFKFVKAKDMFYPDIKVSLCEVLEEDITGKTNEDLLPLTQAKPNTDFFLNSKNQIEVEA